MKTKSIQIITSFVIIFVITFQSVLAVSMTAKDMENMAQAERDFSATAVKEGFRDSFIKFFADDGIGFGPAPEHLKENLLKTPPSTQPRAVIFKWQPYFCDISIDGDMGYTTGPLLYEAVDGKRPPRHGMYFSVWQKQTDGSWKVAIDMGINTPQAIAPIDTTFTSAKNPNGIDKSKAQKSDNGNFDSVDADFSAEISKSGLVNGYNSRLSEEFRVHRQGFMPIVTKVGLKKYLDGTNSKLSFKQMGGKVSNLKDFAFTYGSFHLDGNDAPNGYYIHVWRRNKSGNWKLVIDVDNDLPKKQE